jgi:hypothetical protein
MIANPLGCFLEQPLAARFVRRRRPMKVRGTFLLSVVLRSGSFGTLLTESSLRRSSSFRARQAEAQF